MYGEDCDEMIYNMVKIDKWREEVAMENIWLTLREILVLMNEISYSYRQHWVSNPWESLDHEWIKRLKPKDDDD